jgi:MoaA/NifB/PqqE/SkfB family radical SAM enzyme
MNKTDAFKSMQLAGSFLRKGMIHLNLQILYECNFRCTICDFWSDRFKALPPLSARQTELLSEKIKPLGPLVISIGGGEPLLHNDLIEITRILSRNNFPMMICNGWYITPENARALFAAGMREVSVSIDYATPEKHDAQRGRKGAFERAVNALRILFENRTHPNQRVHMISVVMDDNLDDIEKLIQLSKEIGITYLITFYSNCRGNKESRISRTDISRRLMDLKRNYPEFIALSGFLERYSGAMAGGGISPCFAGKNLFNIDCVGNVTRCIDHLDESVGNIFKEDIRVLQRRLHEKVGSSTCSSCWTSCRGNIETMMYGKKKIKTFIEYREIVKEVPLVRQG